MPAPSVNEPRSHQDVIDLWPSRAALGRQLVNPKTAKAVKASVVRGWFERNSIPEPYWRGIAAAATACGFPAVTYARLSTLPRG